MISPSLNCEARLCELGMKDYATARDPVASQCDVLALEAAIGTSIPDEFRRFLLLGADYRGCIWCPTSTPSPFGDHGLCSFDSARDILGVIDSFMTPRNMITIGSGDFGMFTCLSVCGIDRGSVYGLDGEYRCFWPDEEFERRFSAMSDDIREYLRVRREGGLPQIPAGYDSCYVLASSFTEYLSLCRPESLEDDA
jgi:hypothetical protein